MRILVVFREPRFSFNAIEADRLILQEAAIALKNLLENPETQSENEFAQSVIEKRDAELQFLEAEDLLRLSGNELKLLQNNVQLVLTMAQSVEVLAVLRGFERKGVRVVNSTAAIVSCYRHHMHGKLKRIRVAGYPKSVLIKIPPRSVESGRKKPNLFDKIELFPSEVGYWVKRGDFHALQAEDVTYAENIEGVRQILEAFQERGVLSAIIQKNIIGDVFKVYGVPGHFFHLRWIGNSALSKQTLRVPGASAGNAGAGGSSNLMSNFSINEEKIAESVMSAARQMDLEIFGADCVVDQDGEVHVIDINDWPSFRVCRAEAAKAIARLSRNVLESFAGKALPLSETLSSVFFQRSNVGLMTNQAHADEKEKSETLPSGSTV